MQRTKLTPIKIARLIYIHIVFLLAVTIISCSREQDLDVQVDKQKQFIGEILLTDEEILGLAYAEPEEISEEEALEIVKDFQEQFDKKPSTKSFNTKSYSVLRKTFIDSNGVVLNDRQLSTKGNVREQISIYNIQIDEGVSKSLAYVAADERMPDVIAVVPTHDGKTLDEYTVDPMLHLAQQTLAKNLSDLNSIVDSINKPTIKKLEDKFGELPKKNLYNSIKGNIRRLSRKPIKTKSPVQGTITNILSQVGPLLSTFWHQKTPFNDQMGANTDCGRYSAGCMVVAISQVLGYYQPTMNIKVNNTTTPIQWSAFMTNPNGTDSYGNDYNYSTTAKPQITGLIKAVYDGSDTEAKCDGSSTDARDGINYMKQYLNMTNATFPLSHRPGINMTNIKASLDETKLVLGTGKRLPTGASSKTGHAWVVDGYAVTRLNAGETIVGNNPWQRYNMYLHANMGWGRPIPLLWTLHGTGWYLVGKDNNGSLTFEANQGQTYDIDLTFYTHIVKK